MDATLTPAPRGSKKGDQANALNCGQVEHSPVFHRLNAVPPADPPWFPSSIKPEFAARRQFLI
jgi:hypothetical protein